MRKLLAATALAVVPVFAFCSANAADVTAIVSYADWCLPCQVLMPKLDEAVNEVGSVEVVTLDFTEMSVENLDRQFERAEPLGPGDFLEGRYIKTGFAYVLANGDLIDEIVSSMSKDEIVEIFNAAAEQ